MWSPTKMSRCQQHVRWKEAAWKGQQNSPWKTGLYQRISPPCLIHYSSLNFATYWSAKDQVFHWPFPVLKAHFPVCQAKHNLARKVACKCLTRLSTGRTQGAWPCNTNIILMQFHMQSFKVFSKYCQHCSDPPHGLSTISESKFHMTVLYPVNK